MNQSNSDQALRDHVLYVLRGEGAHVTFEDFVASFPSELCGQRLEGLPYTAWQVLEHMRIAQWDILEFSRNPKHVSPKWPEGYWPPAGSTWDAGAVAGNYQQVPERSEADGESRG